MSTVADVPSPVHPEQVNAAMADCVALEQLRVFRGLLVTRCGVIAALIGVVGLLLGLIHTFAYWFAMGVFVLTPAGVWVVERRRERGLHKKVVKSS
jgi:hypothetical protein